MARAFRPCRAAAWAFIATSLVLPSLLTPQSPFTAQSTNKAAQFSAPPQITLASLGIPAEHLFALPLSPTSFLRLLGVRSTR